MIFGLYNKKKKQIYDSVECQNIQELKKLNILSNQIDFIQLDQSFESYNNHYVLFVENKKLIKIKRILDKPLDQKNNFSALSYIKHQLWKLTFDFYCGNTNRNNYNNRLTKSDTDIYMLGILNYYRKKDGKQIIGNIVINPDNEYMLANLAWGQVIWNQYYQKIEKIKQKLRSSQPNIYIDLTDFKYKNIPYSLSDILQWQKNHQN